MDTILITSSILLWILVLLNLLLTLGLSRRLNVQLPRMDFLKVGQLAPSFKAKTLQGETVTLSSYAGRGMALIFTSPQCKSCREELPKLEALRPIAEQIGVELILVSDADEVDTKSFAEKFGLRFPFLVAPRELTSFLKDYKIVSTPSYYLIDVERKVYAAGFSISELREKMGAFLTGRRSIIN